MSAPAAFHPFPQFVGWRITSRRDRNIKIPLDPKTGRAADTVNPATWGTLAEATALVESGRADGIGFVFTKEDPFFFLDIDKCVAPCGSKWTDLALALLASLPGAYVEVSQSGAGLHAFGVGVVPDHACKNVPLGIELYTTGRFVCLTGTGAYGDAWTDCSASLAALVPEYFPPKVTNVTEWTDAAVEGWNGISDDGELIKKARGAAGARVAFGGASFKDLFDCNVDKLAQCFPGDDGYDASSVDAALAQHLAFWTGNNSARIERIMRMSALVRDKWDEREDYLERTITRATSLQVEFHGVRESVEPMPIATETATVAIGATMVSGFQYLAAAQQIEHFAGCVYVQDIHRVLTPSGAVLKQDQFNVMYGGYVFQLDDGANGKTTKKAWEAFTESQVVRFPKAKGMTFRPLLAPGEIIDQDGDPMVNSYTPTVVQSTPGDVGPFLTHLAKLLPLKTDRETLLAYMAAVVQHKGVKFQWAPLLQGAEGNGKTLLTRCVAAAVGQRHTHYPPAAELAEKFNSWIFDKVFIGVEDVYVPEAKREILETLKPMITNDRLACRAMNTDQVDMSLCANFMLNSNHLDAIRTHASDRRFAFFYTAQQCAQDLERDGMNGDYFPKLYTWLKNGGYAHVTHYLQTYAIPDALNPATSSHRAPQTSSTASAIEHSLGTIEQEVLEAVDEERPGFCGGWISSMALDALLDNLRSGRKLARNKRRSMLEALGYSYHPALKDGRLNTPTITDGGKPRLFIRRGHIHANLTQATEISRAYQEAQGGTVQYMPEGARINA